MERDEKTRRKSNSRNPLNVSSGKIEETRARIDGDTSRRAFEESIDTSPEFFSSAGSSLRSKDSNLAIEETGQLEDSTGTDEGKGLETKSCKDIQERLNESNLVSSSLSTESDDKRLGLSEDADWIRRNFKNPLAFAMRDLLARKPADPVDFLASWLLNYRNTEERLKLRLQQDQELLEERMKIQQFLSKSSSKTEGQIETNKPDSGAEMSEGDEGIVDRNFQDYKK